MDPVAIFRERLDAWTAEAREHSIDHFALLLERCESPIERLLAPHLLFLGANFIPPQLPIGIGWRERHELHAQYEVGAYRLDFALIVDEDSTFGNPVRLAIECDGRAFHDLTPEQKDADRKRDAELLAMGWHTLRFSGSQIYNDAAGCAKMVDEAISGLFTQRMISKTAHDLLGFRQPSENRDTDDAGGNF